MEGEGLHDEVEDSEAEVGIVVLDQVEQDQVHSPLPKTILEFRNQRNHTIYQPFSPCVTVQNFKLDFWMGCNILHLQLEDFWNIRVPSRTLWLRKCFKGWGQRVEKVKNKRECDQT